MTKEKIVDSPCNGWMKEMLNLPKDWKPSKVKRRRSARVKTVTEPYQGYVTDDNIKWGRERAKELMRIRFLEEE